MDFLRTRVSRLAVYWKPPFISGLTIRRKARAGLTFVRLQIPDLNRFFDANRSPFA